MLPRYPPSVPIHSPVSAKVSYSDRASLPTLHACVLLLFNTFQPHFRRRENPDASHITVVLSALELLPRQWDRVVQVGISTFTRMLCSATDVRRFARGVESRVVKSWHKESDPTLVGHLSLESGHDHSG